MADRESTTQRTAACAHDGCRCAVPAGKTYCSEHCAKAAMGSGALLGDRIHHAGCQCGHPACA